MSLSWDHYNNGQKSVAIRFTAIPGLLHSRTERAWRYVETNKANIQRVMADLQEINNPDIKYSAFLMDDGKSFVHFVLRANDEAQKTISELSSFQEFQRQLKESGPEVPPNAENLEVVGLSWDIF